ncbi:hypothetical protein GMDG_06002 [Pseudogymnoascus destructans 20631-21]|uniref:Uncharacterized protein n=1 Tax=Pseudogymnoascus destructans (strain ATCC MYA-4855 / 20631-21) TaxID=658429 RepID=L8FTZ4_PSED2|nr:hypothetical protein GMDG_06002 [Pseudogymnoascus destructans 20631-21]
MLNHWLDVLFIVLSIVMPLNVFCWAAAEILIPEFLRDDVSTLSPSTTDRTTFSCSRSCSSAVITGSGGSAARYSWDEAERQWALHEALSCAAGRGHLAVVELLCQHVDVSKPCMTGTPFTMSASIGESTEVMQMLLRLGAGLDPSALYNAADQGHLALVLDILSRRPMDIFYPDSEGRTPLHHAAKKGHADIIQALLITVPTMK